MADSFEDLELFLKTISSDMDVDLDNVTPSLKENETNHKTLLGDIALDDIPDFSNTEQPKNEPVEKNSGIVNSLKDNYTKCTEQNEMVSPNAHDDQAPKVNERVIFNNESNSEGETSSVANLIDDVMKNDDLENVPSDIAYTSEAREASSVRSTSASRSQTPEQSTHAPVEEKKSGGREEHIHVREITSTEDKTSGKGETWNSNQTLDKNDTSGEEKTCSQDEPKGKAKTNVPSPGREACNTEPTTNNSPRANIENSQADENEKTVNENIDSSRYTKDFSFVMTVVGETAGSDNKNDTETTGSGDTVHPTPNNTPVPCVTSEQSTIASTPEQGLNETLSSDEDHFKKCATLKGVKLQGVTKKYMCKECNYPMRNPDHYLYFGVECKVPSCRFATKCKTRYMQHFQLFHTTDVPMAPREHDLQQPWYCSCGMRFLKGNKLAEHMVICTKASHAHRKPAERPLELQICDVRHVKKSFSENKKTKKKPEKTSESKRKSFKPAKPKPITSEYIGDLSSLSSSSEDEKDEEDFRKKVNEKRLQIKLMQEQFAERKAREEEERIRQAAKKLEQERLEEKKKLKEKLSWESDTERHKKKSSKHRRQRSISSSSSDREPSPRPKHKPKKKKHKEGQHQSHSHLDRGNGHEKVHIKKEKNFKDKETSKDKLKVKVDEPKTTQTESNKVDGVRIGSSDESGTDQIQGSISAIIDALDSGAEKSDGDSKTKLVIKPVTVADPTPVTKPDIQLRRKSTEQKETAERKPTRTNEEKSKAIKDSKIKGWTTFSGFKVRRSEVIKMRRREMFLKLTNCDDLVKKIENKVHINWNEYFQSENLERTKHDTTEATSKKRVILSGSSDSSDNETLPVKSERLSSRESSVLKETKGDKYKLVPSGNGDKESSIPNSKYGRVEKDLKKEKDIKREKEIKKEHDMKKHKEVKKEKDAKRGEHYKQPDHKSFKFDEMRKKLAQKKGGSEKAVSSMKPAQNTSHMKNSYKIPRRKFVGSNTKDVLGELLENMRKEVTNINAQPPKPSSSLSERPSLSSQPNNSLSERPFVQKYPGLGQQKGNHASSTTGHSTPANIPDKLQQYRNSLKGTGKPPSLLDLKFDSPLKSGSPEERDVDNWDPGTPPETEDDYDDEMFGDGTTLPPERILVSPLQKPKPSTANIRPVVKEDRSKEIRPEVSESQPNQPIERDAPTNVHYAPPRQIPEILAPASPEEVLEEIEEPRKIPTDVALEDEWELDSSFKVDPSILVADMQRKMKGVQSAVITRRLGTRLCGNHFERNYIVQSNLCTVTISPFAPKALAQPTIMLWMGKTKEFYVKKLHNGNSIAVLQYENSDVGDTAYHEIKREMVAYERKAGLQHEVSVRHPVHDFNVNLAGHYAVLDKFENRNSESNDWYRFVILENVPDLVGQEDLKHLFPDIRDVTDLRLPGFQGGMMLELKCESAADRCVLDNKGLYIDGQRVVVGKALTVLRCHQPVADLQKQMNDNTFCPLSDDTRLNMCKAIVEFNVTRRNIEGKMNMSAEDKHKDLQRLVKLRQPIFNHLVWDTARRIHESEPLPETDDIQPAFVKRQRKHHQLKKRLESPLDVDSHNSGETLATVVEIFTQYAIYLLHQVPKFFYKNAPEVDKEEAVICLVRLENNIVGLGVGPDKDTAQAEAAKDAMVRIIPEDLSPLHQSRLVADRSTLAKNIQFADPLEMQLLYKDYSARRSKELQEKTQERADAINREGLDSDEGEIDVSMVDINKYSVLGDLERIDMTRKVMDVEAMRKRYRQSCNGNIKTANKEVRRKYAILGLELKMNLSHLAADTLRRLKDNLAVPEPDSMQHSHVKKIIDPPTPQKSKKKSYDRKLKQLEEDREKMRFLVRNLDNYKELSHTDQRQLLKTIQAQTIAMENFKQELMKEIHLLDKTDKTTAGVLRKALKDPESIFTKLNEFTEKHLLVAPKYDHHATADPSAPCRCTITANQKLLSVGLGTTPRLAKLAAAHDAVSLLMPEWKQANIKDAQEIISNKKQLWNVKLLKERSYTEILEEHSRRQYQCDPMYGMEIVANPNGPFLATVTINGRKSGAGNGTTKPNATCAAAKSALSHIMPNLVKVKHRLESSGTSASVDKRSLVAPGWVIIDVPELFSTKANSKDKFSRKPVVTVLPEGWRAVDSDIVDTIYVNDTEGVIQFSFPTEENMLPPGYEEGRDELGSPYFYSSRSGLVTSNRPFRPPKKENTPASTSSTISDANKPVKKEPQDQATSTSAGHDHSDRKRKHEEKLDKRDEKRERLQHKHDKESEREKRKAHEREKALRREQYERDRAKRHERKKREYEEKKRREQKQQLIKTEAAPSMLDPAEAKRMREKLQLQKQKKREEAEIKRKHEERVKVEVMPQFSANNAPLGNQSVSSTVHAEANTKWVKPEPQIQNPHVQTLHSQNILEPCDSSFEEPPLPNVEDTTDSMTYENHLERVAFKRIPTVMSIKSPTLLNSQLMNDSFQVDQFKQKRGVLGDKPGLLGVKPHDPTSTACTDPHHSHPNTLGDKLSRSDNRNPHLGEVSQSRGLLGDKPMPGLLDDPSLVNRRGQLSGETMPSTSRGLLGDMPDYHRDEKPYASTGLLGDQPGSLGSQPSHGLLGDRPPSNHEDEISTRRRPSAGLLGDRPAQRGLLGDTPEDSVDDLQAPNFYRETINPEDSISNQGSVVGVTQSRRIPGLDNYDPEDPTEDYDTAPTQGVASFLQNLLPGFKPSPNKRPGLLPPPDSVQSRNRQGLLHTPPPASDEYTLAASQQHLSRDEDISVFDTGAPVQRRPIPTIISQHSRPQHPENDYKQMYAEDRPGPPEPHTQPPEVTYPAQGYNDPACRHLEQRPEPGYYRDLNTDYNDPGLRSHNTQHGPGYYRDSNPHIRPSTGSSESGHYRDANDVIVDPSLRPPEPAGPPPEPRGYAGHLRDSEQGPGADDKATVATQLKRALLQNQLMKVLKENLVAKMRDCRNSDEMSTRQTGAMMEPNPKLHGRKLVPPLFSNPGDSLSPRSSTSNQARHIDQDPPLHPRRPSGYHARPDYRQGSHSPHSLPSRPSLSLRDHENDPDELERRQIQIDQGKATDAYLRYRQTVLKELRRSRDPRTPDKYMRVSGDAWDRCVHEWRMHLRPYAAPGAFPMPE